MLIRTTQNVGIEYVSASVMHRVVAAVIDTMVMAFALFGVILMFNEVLLSLAGDWSIVAFALVYGMILAYPLIMEWMLDGRTIGKRVMQTRVVRLDGRQATFGAFFIRWLLGLLEIMSSFGSLAFVTALLSKNQQRLGDMAAGTVVVREPKPVTLDELMLSVQADGTVIYPAARFLTEDEVETIRQVLLSARSGGVDAARALELMWTTAEALQQRMGAGAITQPFEFLSQVLESYQASHSGADAPASSPTPSEAR